MTEDRPEIVRLDEAIDRAVRDLTAHEAPADLRARVLARLEEPAPAGVWWSPGRLVAAAAAVAVVAIAAYLAWPSRPAPLTEPESVVAEARPPAGPPAATPAPVEATPVEPAAPARGTDAPPRAAPRATERAVAATAAAEREPYEFTMPRLVDPLEPPPAVVIEPLAEPALVIEPITIDRLTFEPIVINPLRMGA